MNEQNYSSNHVYGLNEILVNFIENNSIATNENIDDLSATNKNDQNANNKNNLTINHVQQNASQQQNQQQPVIRISSNDIITPDTHHHPNFNMNRLNNTTTLHDNFVNTSYGHSSKVDLIHQLSPLIQPTTLSDEPKSHHQHITVNSHNIHHPEGSYDFFSSQQSSGNASSRSSAGDIPIVIPSADTLLPPQIATHSRRLSVGSLNGQFFNMNIEDAPKSPTSLSFFDNQLLSRAVSPLPVPFNINSPPQQFVTDRKPTSFSSKSSLDVNENTSPFVSPQSLDPTVLVVPSPLIYQLASPLISPLSINPSSNFDLDTHSPSDTWLSQVIQSQSLNEPSAEEIERIIQKSKSEIDQELNKSSEELFHPQSRKRSIISQDNPTPVFSSHNIPELRLSLDDVDIYHELGSAKLLASDSNILKSPNLRTKHKDRMRSTSPYPCSSSQTSLHPEFAATERRASVCSVSSDKSSGTDIPPPIRIKTPKIEKSVMDDMVKKNTHHKGNKVMYQCPYENCGKQFTRPFNLKSHYIAEHTDERPHVCEQCGQDFVRSHDLKRHIKTRHEMADRCKCIICNREFARKDALKRHLYPKDKVSACGLAMMKLEGKSNGQNHDKDSEIE